MAELPDPTIDLDWSGYVGAIHEIFARNAQAHPDRICVVETASSTTPERRFTYKQIYEASNTLAYYLHDTGIANGDVVMIWAHRSVDLVISIMGVLASAATMSVLDPAYPPEKQKVHLEVAHPRGLINIQRAGDLDTTLVRPFITNELDLKAEVYRLHVSDDGILVGETADGKDIFADARGKASKPPPTLVGPDSNPTLSFTSGSEGRPKGVLGRHYSLAYYFFWMAERFELSEHSRFTLLSGIAHDPVQRDIFTPLFLGAQLLVPSAEDIMVEQLAFWFKKYEPTVTHLTPAMGQILVNATAEFPSLDRAFFVGDVLRTQDCQSLRNLARNANIVNMYGTTETSRAVSYFEIPSNANDPKALERLKDYVPAGQGMKNVQLLVVDREDRTKLLGPDQEGEIYVRAAGLAEGYLGDAEKNKEKFVPNWFTDTEKWKSADSQRSKDERWRKYFKGPRDRLYRTGDLGRYHQSGIVECTGRADDQVKVRGFRIELNEVDSHLSQNQLVRKCKTYKRKDDESLVSYIIPETRQWKSWLEGKGHEDTEGKTQQYGNVLIFHERFKRLQDEVRDFLKARVAHYAVPSLFIIIDDFPLNPNGKVDKPNLPPPDLIEQKVEASKKDISRWNSLSKNERIVAEKWSEQLGGMDPRTIKPDDEFFQLGGHSLSANVMLLKLRNATTVTLLPNTLYSHPSLKAFSAQLDRRLANGMKGHVEEQQSVVDDYARSLDDLLSTLPKTFASSVTASIDEKGETTIFLTGGTGFLGVHILHDLLQRTSRPLKLVVHVRAKDVKAGTERLKAAMRSYGLWRDEWSSKITCVLGDLTRPKLGLDLGIWEELCKTVDIVIHNGAIVHWIRPYADLKTANVDSTIDAIRLCQASKASLLFVSSTSVLDTEHYVNLSSKAPVPEDDDMVGSRTGLGNGYGQSKWVSEQLVLEAGRRGLQGSILRPGYILGSTTSSICNTDDFLIRLLKGCIQLHCRPQIANTINAVPVDTVARIAASAALHPPYNTSSVRVLNVDPNPHRLSIPQYLAPLQKYGWAVPEVPYTTWRDRLVEYVSAAPQGDGDGGARGGGGGEQHALLPLFQFCIEDLPANTRAPVLSDKNTREVMNGDGRTDRGKSEGGESGYGITEDLVGRYLAYLVKVGFLTPPSQNGEGEGEGEKLPAVEVPEGVVVGGRGGAVLK